MFWTRGCSKRLVFESRVNGSDAVRDSNLLYCTVKRVSAHKAKRTRESDRAYPIMIACWRAR